MNRTSLEREYDLERTDIQILRYLRKNPVATSSELSRELALPRTSVHFRLGKFKERGWCEMKKLRNLSQWSLTVKGIALLARSNTTLQEMSFAEGMSSFEETMLALASQSHPCRVNVFEPSEQTRLFVESINEAVFTKISDLIVKNDIIVEAIFGERSVEYVRQMGVNVRRHMIQRPLISYQLADSLLNFNHQILCFREDTYFLNYKTLVMTHLRNKEITDTFRSMFEHYRLQATKINFNESVRD